MNKKVFLLLLIVISLISMSAISAADVDDNNQTLALDSSSDVSLISAGNADVLAMSNNDEIQQISNSDLLGDDDKDPVVIHIDDSIRDQTIHEDEEFKIEFEIWDASGDEPCPFIIDTDDGFEVELVIGDEVNKTTETDDFEGEFTVEDGLGPGMWEIVLKSDGTDDFGPCESGMRIPILPMSGSRIILDEFDPDWTENGKITLEYNETMNVDFKAITDASKKGLRNVNFQFQLDNNIPYFVTSGDDGELSFKLENLTVGNHVFRISLSREAWDYGFRFQDFEISIVVKPIPVILIVNPESFDLMVDDEDDIDAKLYVYRNEEIGDELDPDEVGNITLTSSNSSIVTVDDEGNVVAVGEGKTVIIVGYPGNDMYAAAEDVVVEVAVSKYDTEIILEEDSFDLMVDDTDSIEAKLYVSGNDGTGDELNPNEVGNLTFVSSDESVVTVDSEGNFVAVGEGEAAITVSFAGNRKYKASSDTVTVTVSRYDTEISVEDSYYELIVDDNDTIVAVLDPDVGDITFTSSDESVVTVDSQGNIKAVGGGRTGIIVSFAGDYKYKPSRAVVTVSVSKFDTSISIDEYFLDMYVGDNDAIVAELDPDDAGELTYTSSNTDVVTVDSEGNVVAVCEGRAGIIVSFAGTNRYKASSDTVTVSVSRYDTEIIVDPDDLDMFVGDADIIVAVLDPIEAGDITFTSSDESVVTVSAKGKVKAVGDGDAVLTVSFAGNQKYKPCEEKVTVKVSLIETSIDLNSEDSLELNVGDEDSIVAELDPEDAGFITFTSSNKSVVTVDSEGNIKAVGEGEADIVLSFDGDYKYAPAESVNVTVSVSRIETSIDLNSEDSLDLFVGETDAITAELDPEDAGFITFTSSNTSVVTVDEMGNIIAVGEGEAEIVLSFDGDYRYAPAENVTVTVIVSKKDVRIELMSNDTLKLIVDDEKRIVACIIIDDGSEMSPFDLSGSLEYNVDSDDVVEVDDEGNVKAIGEGEAIIIISFSGNDMYNAADDVTVSVNVSMIDTSINLNSEDSLDLFVGDKDTIVAKLNPIEAGDITFTSTNSSIVTVDDEGNVVAVGEGEADIILSFDGDNKYRDAEDVFVTVTVSKIDTVINVDEDSLELFVGDEDSVVAELTPNDAGSVSFVSSDESVVTVDEEGNVVAVGEGDAVITISFDGDDKYEAAEDVFVTVSVSKIDTNISVDDVELELNVGDEDSIVAELTPDEAGNVSFVSSDESVVTVDEDGSVVAVGEGEATITVSFAGDDKYEAADDVVVAVSVSKIDTSIDVDEDSLELFVGDDGSIVAELDPEDAGDVTFTSSDESVVTVDEDGSVVAVGEGEATITVSFAGDERYNAAENVTVTVTVSKIDTNIDVDEDSLKLFVGDEDSIIAELDPEEAGNVTFVSSDESVVTVDVDGNVVAVGEGEAVITINFAGDDKYSDSEAIVTVTVSKVDTMISADKDYLNLFVGDEDNIVAFLVVDYDSGMIPVSHLNSLKYTSSNESVVTVDDEGNVVAVADGEAAIIISFDGDDTYSACEDVIIPVTVSMKDVAINAGPKSLDLLVGENGEIYYFPIPEDLDVKITSSDESVITVENDDGVAVVTAVGEGNAFITLTVGDGIIYVMNSTTVSLKVSKIATEIIVDDSLILDVGEKTNIDLTTDPEDLDVTYESNDTSVVVVDKNGKVTAVSNGTALITIKIEEDNMYKSSQATIFVIVNPEKEPEKEELNITGDAEDITFGEDAIIEFFGLGDAIGNITITIDCKNYTIPISDGEATFDIPDLDIGYYLIPVYYSGDDKYAPANIYIDLNVGGDKSDVISADDVTKYYGDSERFVVVVTDYKGNPVSGKNVSFIINGVPYTRTTNDDGSASIPLNLISGSYNVTVIMDNKTFTSEVNILPTVNGSDVVKVFRNGTHYFATFRDREGNYLKEGTEVIFNINGVMYDRKISGNEGIAKLNINLEQGEYIITAMNTVTGENAANKITVIPKLIENRDITKYYRNGTQYTVKVIGDGGKAVGAGVTVTFNINGVFYTRTTNESGIVKLNLNLQPGDYVITAEYMNCKVSNNVKVLPVLSASDLSMKYRDGSKFTAKLVDGEGRPYSGQTVQFNINGVMYNRVTDSSGQAKLNINLMAGEYIITSSYNGSNIANTIKIAA